MVRLSTLILAVAPFLLVEGSHNKDCENPADVGNWFINFCEEKCVCEVTATNEYSHVCYREREEFTCMSSSRRQRFLDTYKAVTTPGNPQYDQMRQLIQKHNDGFHNGIHSTQYFLPWHRWYIKAVEDILRNEDCRVTMPWWRWSKKSTNWWTGTPFHSSTTWLGGNGVAPNQCVNSGAFNAPWAPPDRTCLRRSFWTSSFPTTTQIVSTLNTPATNFWSFSDDLEIIIHNTPHMRIGGDMASLSSPRAPEFFLHHSYIDQIWDQWQRKSSSHMNAYGSYPKVGHPLPYTYGPSPSNVDDHFVLKDSRVIYVNVQSSRLGRGHLIMLPKCLWLKVEKHVFDLQKINDGLLKTNPKIINEIPQLPWEAPSERELEWWFEGADEKQASIFRGRLKEAQAKAQINNRLLSAPTKEFENPASQMLGYDVQKVVDYLQLCPVGYLRDQERNCVKDKLMKKELKKINKEVKKGKVIGGEVYSVKDLEG